MKLIHCNVEAFNYFDAFCDFLKQEDPDILSLVEASTGKFFGNDSFQRDYVGELASKFSYHSVFHPTVFRDF